MGTLRMYLMANCTGNTSMPGVFSMELQSTRCMMSCTYLYKSILMEWQFSIPQSFHCGQFIAQSMNCHPARGESNWNQKYTLGEGERVFIIFLGGSVRPGPLPYFRPKCTTIPTLFQTWLSKCTPSFRLEMLENDTLWGGTYLIWLIHVSTLPQPHPPEIFTLAFLCFQSVFHIILTTII